jgi:hypothetical protein
MAFLFIRWPFLLKSCRHLRGSRFIWERNPGLKFSSKIFNLGYQAFGTPPAGLSAALTFIFFLILALITGTAEGQPVPYCATQEL